MSAKMYNTIVVSVVTSEYVSCLKAIIETDFFSDLTSKTAIQLLSQNFGHKTPPMPPLPGIKALLRDY